MHNETLKRTVLVVALLGAGYVAGVAAPSVSAYAQDETRLLKQITTELRGIHRALDKIAGRIK